MYLCQGSLLTSLAVLTWSGVRRKNHVAGTALHKCGKSDSQIFKLLKPLKISWNFIYRAIKSCKELWGVEDRAQLGCLKSVMTEAAIKTVWERIHWNLLSKQKIMSWELNISIQPSHASHQGWSTHDSAPPLKGTPPYSCSEGDLMDKSTASPSVARWEWARKYPLHGREIFHHQVAV